ncbi:MAG: AAA family ATPase [Acidimicrobiales bacterium]|nr:AAA family ATPase [Acidimicrobiales bacterium]
MRVALAGKGGVGKTTLSATLARLVGRTGTPVVAIDADSNPNLAAALGAGDDLADDAGFLPFGLVSRRPDGPALSEPVADVLAAHCIPAPDGVQLLRMGQPEHADEGCLCSAHATVSAVLADLGRRDDALTLMDLEASPEHLSRGTARHADVLVMVTEPYYRSLETIRRVSALAAELEIPIVTVLANKVRNDEEEEAVREYCQRHDLSFTSAIRWSDDVLDADSAGRPVLDAAPGSTLVAGVRDLIDELGIPLRSPDEATVS